MMAYRLFNTGRAVLGRPVVLLGGLALAALLWSYWTTLGELADRWSYDPHYSHGYLVPVFALVLLGVRWKNYAAGPFRPSAWGMAFLVAGVVIRLWGTYYFYQWYDNVSLLFCLVGLTVLLGGWQALRWSWPGLAFLLFMMPMPYRVETALAMPLRRLATQASTYVIQTFGIGAVADGNTIYLEDYPIAIVEACSGLSMLMVFFALATAVAFLIDRPLWEKIVVVVSAVPIALVANIARISLTAIVFEWLGRDEANEFFHDWAGWFMMPLAVLMFWGELLLVQWLWVLPSQKPSGPLGLWLEKTGSGSNRPAGSIPVGSAPAAAKTGREAAVASPRTD
jgi:exosortase